MSVKSLRKGDHRALAKAISIFENEEPRAAKLAKEIFPHTGKAFVIGVTGPPGSGKSTLIDKMIKHYRSKKKSVGVLAIDPSSIFTGGALLGDRLRMASHNLDPNVFIRSMASRGGVGGLAKASRNAIRLLDVSGKDIIIVETVGAGQSEVDIVKVADTTVLVTVPQLGDQIQTFKAGLIEIADIFVVNMADLAGADKMVTHLLGGVVSKNGWTPPVLKTVAKSGEGVDALIEALEKRREFLAKKNVAEKNRVEKIKAEISSLVAEKISKASLKELSSSKDFEKIIELVNKKKIDPETASEELFAKLWKKR
ncbi:MAG: methylmalonyl Co-A mutase-associated GTPase MeaB [Thaumarchaeota archaeon]|nr:methylmalonyl Co-A mutase-associated GTPase MeaB [Nitrososphaerota archaeon]